MLEIPVITGLGPISAIGSGRENFWHSLLAGKSGISKIANFDTSRSPCKIGAEIRNFRVTDFLDRKLIPSRRLSRAVELGIGASSLAIKDAKIDLSKTNRDRIGVFVGTSVASLAESFRTRDVWLKEDRLAPNSSFHLFNHSAACIISAVFDLRGPTLTISTGCNSGIDALGQAVRLIQLGIVDAMLVVGTDCELFPEILAVLSASESLSTHYNDHPESSPRPFDADRDGVVLGEGAGAIWIESKSHAETRAATMYALIAGYSGAAAGRQRNYSPVPNRDLSPSVRALSGAMKEAGWKAEDVHLMSANGSASIAYDRLEAESFRETFQEALPAIRVHSIKSMIGLPGGASSALQLIAACLSLQSGMIPPTLNHDRLDSDCSGLRIVQKLERFQPQNILLHSIGLGGFYYSSAALCAV